MIPNIYAQLAELYFVATLHLQQIAEVYTRDLKLVQVLRNHSVKKKRKHIHTQWLIILLSQRRLFDNEGTIIMKTIYM